MGVAISDHVSAQSEGERFPLAHVLCRSTDGSFLCKAKVSMPCTFVLGGLTPASPTALLCLRISANGSELSSAKYQVYSSTEGVFIC